LVYHKELELEFPENEKEENFRFRFRCAIRIGLNSKRPLNALPDRRTSVNKWKLTMARNLKSNTLFSFSSFAEYGTSYNCIATFINCRQTHSFHRQYDQFVGSFPPLRLGAHRDCCFSRFQKLPIDNWPVSWITAQYVVTDNFANSFSSGRCPCGWRHIHDSR
jgi:hypothetical protein